MGFQPILHLTWWPYRGTYSVLYSNLNVILVRFKFPHKFQREVFSTILVKFLVPVPVPHKFCLNRPWGLRPHTTLPLDQGEGRLWPQCHIHLYNSHACWKLHFIQSWAGNRPLACLYSIVTFMNEANALKAHHRVLIYRATTPLRDRLLLKLDITIVNYCGWINCETFIFWTDSERHEPVSRPDASHDPQEMSGDGEDVREDRSVRGRNRRALSRTNYSYYPFGGDRCCS